MPKDKDFQVSTSSDKKPTLKNILDEDPIYQFAEAQDFPNDEIKSEKSKKSSSSKITDYPVGEPLTKEVVISKEKNQTPLIEGANVYFEHEPIIWDSKAKPQKKPINNNKNSLEKFDFDYLRNKKYPKILFPDLPPTYVHEDYFDFKKELKNASKDLRLKDSSKQYNSAEEMDKKLEYMKQQLIAFKARGPSGPKIDRIFINPDHDKPSNIDASELASSRKSESGYAPQKQAKSSGPSTSIVAQGEKKSKSLYSKLFKKSKNSTKNSKDDSSPTR